MNWVVAFENLPSQVHFMVSNITTINKSDLIKKMAEDAGITQAQAQAALNALISGSKEALQNNDKISLLGFGTFSVVQREARKGRNPQTGKALHISAKKTVRFRAGKSLKDFVH